MLLIVDEEGWHQQSELDCAKLQTSRLDLKVLGWLRVLGRGNVLNHSLCLSVSYY